MIHLIMFVICVFTNNLSDLRITMLSCVIMWVTLPHIYSNKNAVQTNKKHTTTQKIINKNVNKR